MKVLKHWEPLLEIFMESREGANVKMFTGGSVKFELYSSRTLRALFEFMALLVCGESGYQRPNRQQTNRKEKKGATCNVGVFLSSFANNDVLTVVRN